MAISSDNKDYLEDTEDEFASKNNADDSEINEYAD